MREVFFMVNCSIALQILPLGATQEATLEVVDSVIAFIASKTDNYEVAAFETTIQGDYDTLMPILKEAIEVASQTHHKIFTNVKISYDTKGSVLTIEDKTTKHRH
ncbi:thiamine-binding protein [Facklamia tabacinasalis]|uniref:Thiamine-binding protein n=2 Tax=Ruoffia tabacinasalis TaxID=87458 RepID=A0ABS0LI09_9LACT|nr:thiamine-binding protein [Ruoffia tabacinasalis]